MREIAQYIYDVIWQEQLWLPNGTSYKDLKAENGFYYAQENDLLILPFIAAIIYAVRQIYGRFIAYPIASLLNIDDVTKSKKPEPNQDLLHFYKTTSRCPSQKEVQSLSKRTDWSIRRINRWFRRQRNCNRPSTRKKFVESSWRFLFYLFAFAYGIYTISKAPFILYHPEFWTSFPSSMWPEAYYYYVIEGSFYISLLYTVMSDVKRKDFKEQLIHHAATLILIYFSYTVHYSRIGTIVMIVHDISDIPLEFAKCISYAKFALTSEIIFGVFAVTFFITRLIIFPFCVLRLTLFHFAPWGDWIFSVIFFNFFLFVLQALHIFWMMTILKMIWIKISERTTMKDERSDEEEESTSDEQNDSH